jgi:hypothetical protein
MSEPTLRELERDVEATRAKLARDLSTLRSPSTFAEFSEEVKQEAIGAKDAVLDHAKSSALSFFDDLKARAAANPAAALVIGAGVAWRLFKHPPIATALVGAGLYSLWHAKPGDVRGLSNREYLEEAKENLQEQASEFALEAKDKAGELAMAAKDKAGELAAATKVKASELATSAKERAAELATTAKDQARGFVTTAGDQIEDMASKAANQATRLAQDARDTAQEWRSSAAGEVRQMSTKAVDAASGAADRIYQGARDAAANAHARAANVSVTSPDGRDKMLLGVAGLAVAAAVGMAYQRRTEEDR